MTLLYAILDNFIISLRKPYGFIIVSSYLLSLEYSIGKSIVDDLRRTIFKNIIDHINNYKTEGASLMFPRRPAFNAILKSTNIIIKKISDKVINMVNTEKKLIVAVDNECLIQNNCKRFVL